MHIVCAAANEGGRSRINIAYPARFGNVLCVGGCDACGHPTDFSSRGREIVLVAPSVGIQSCAGNGRSADDSGAPVDYTWKSGTSIAVPMVAGVCAVLVAYCAGEARLGPVSCETLRDLLVEMCRHPGRHDEGAGYGMLNVTGRFSHTDFVLVVVGELQGRSSVVGLTSEASELLRNLEGRASDTYSPDGRRRLSPKQLVKLLLDHSSRRKANVGTLLDEMRNRPWRISADVHKGGIGNPRLGRGVDARPHFNIRTGWHSWHIRVGEVNGKYYVNEATF